MDSSPTDSLLASIGAYLRSCRGDAGGGSSLDYWHEHPTISAAEVEMLMRLGNDALCVEALAQMLGRDITCTQALLDALVGIGILERVDERYTATESTRLYCWAAAKGHLPPPYI
jgi:hypothetical protein